MRKTFVVRYRIMYLVRVTQVVIANDHTRVTLSSVQPIVYLEYGNVHFIRQALHMCSTSVSHALNVHKHQNEITIKNWCDLSFMHVHAMECV